MKKLFILTVCLVLLQTAYSQKKDFSRWSVTAGLGPCLFDGDVNQTRMGLLPTSFQEVSYGFTAEYALTPVWGLALDFYHFPLSGRNSDVSFYTPLNTSDINATINFTKWIFPQSRSKISIIGELGLGYALYTSNYRAPDPVNSPEVSIAGRAISVPVTFSLEYDLSKSFSLGGKVHYRAYNKDNMEGDPRYNYKGVTNDFVAAGTLYVRYKINAEKKNHIRNISFDDYHPNPCCDTPAEPETNTANIPAEIANAKKKPIETANPTSKLDSALNYFKAKLAAQDAKIDSLKALLSNNGPDTDADGVPDIRDKDNSTPPNTPVDFWGVALKLPKQMVSKQPNDTIINEDDMPGVYFDFDKTGLDKTALEAIRKVAAKMKADKTLKVEVRGYCDYMGNIAYNQKLSIRRSAKVKAQLMKQWGISADRIITNGRGRITRPSTKFRPNRRCDFFFNK